MSRGPAHPAQPAGRIRLADLWPIVLGVGALVAGTAFGWDSRLVDAVVAPPPVARAALVALATVLGGWLLLRAVRRIGAARHGPCGDPDLAAMVRGIRLVFLAVAAFAAATGWALSHPLPIVIAFVIAGVDVVETSFLLLVVGLRRR